VNSQKKMLTIPKRIPRTGMFERIMKQIHTTISAIARTTDCAAWKRTIWLCFSTARNRIPPTIQKR
jgi:hypothetical protein